MTAPVTSPLMELSDVTGGYGQLTVVRDVSLVVPAGAVTAVLGPNGAGKSTLLRVVSGLTSQHAGSVTVAGQDLTGLRADRRLDHLGLVPEGRLLLGRFSVRDNVYLFAVRRLGRRRAAAAVDRVFEIFPALAGRAGDDAMALSGGQQQMLAIARALALEPQVLLLDEPSVGLAPVILDELAEVLRDLVADGLGVLVTEQNTGWLTNVVQEVYVVQHGRVVASGDRDLLTDTQALQNLYLGGNPTGTALDHSAGGAR